jgi:hypothetical protein
VVRRLQGGEVMPGPRHLPFESPTPRGVGLSPVVGAFMASDGAAMIYVLDDGRAVRAGATGSLLLTGVGGTFVRMLTEVEALRADTEAAYVFHVEDDEDTSTPGPTR